MGYLSGAVGHLKKELKRAQQEVQRYSAALAALGRSTSNGPRTLSADARNRISLAQKKRWAATRKGSQPVVVRAAKTSGSVPAKRTMSAGGRKRIAAAQRARWAKVRAGKK
jgi:hypothetical protein